MEELSLNILDVAGNSLKAQATLVEIQVEECKDRQMLIISIQDNGCGMDEEELAAVTDPFYTTRTTRQVGLGIPLFKMAAEMSGGSFRMESQPGKGTRIEAVFGLNHIDRMPLGDMTATMITLIQGNPEINFVYKHRIDDKNFIADTREMRKILAGIPLNEPRVMTFIKEYMEENLAQLEG